MLLTVVLPVLWQFHSVSWSGLDHTILSITSGVPVFIILIGIIVTIAAFQWAWNLVITSFR